MNTVKTVWLKALFFLLIVRPVVLFVVGINLRYRERLPSKGPALLIANHNSHLDTVVLMSLFPLSMLHRVKAVAAADYFLSSPWMKFFSLNVIGIIPIHRRKAEQQGDPLEGIGVELAKGSIVIFFPEGSRGEPEKMSQFKFGISKLAERFPTVPIHPIFLHGLGKALPRGEGLLVPFFCDVVVGEPVFKTEEAPAFIQKLTDAVNTLASEVRVQKWD